MIFLGVLELQLTSAVFAGGFSVLDIGMTRSGMMAVMSNVDEPSAIYHNPACLTDQKGTQFYFFNLYTHIFTSLEMRNPDGTYSEKIRPSQADGIGPFLGLTSDLGLQRWTFGAALLFPNVYGAAFPEDAETRYHLVQGVFATGYLSFAASYAVNERLSLGGAYSLIYVRMIGERKYDMLGTRNPDSDMELRMDSDDLAMGWSLSLRYKPAPNWSIGFGYWPKTDLRLEGDLDVYLPGDVKFLSTYIHTSMLIPETYRGGVSYRFHPRWMAAVDVNYWKYSDYEWQKIETGMDDLFGDQSARKNYGDSISIGAGLRHTLSEKTSLSVGLLRDWSPIPPEYYMVDNPKTDYLALALAAFRNVGRGFRLEGGVVLSHYEGMDIRNSKTNPPTNARGDALAVELDFAILYRFQ